MGRLLGGDLEGKPGDLVTIRGERAIITGRLATAYRSRNFRWLGKVRRKSGDGWEVRDLLRYFRAARGRHLQNVAVVAAETVRGAGREQGWHSLERATQDRAG